MSKLFWPTQVSDKQSSVKMGFTVFMFDQIQLVAGENICFMLSEINKVS